MKNSYLSNPTEQYDDEKSFSDALLQLFRTKAITIKKEITESQHY